jgi:hypothetical protein
VSEVEIKDSDSDISADIQAWQWAEVKKSLPHTPQNI